MTLPRLVIAAIAKDESAYLLDWVFHHLYIGASKVIVILNNTTDNSLRLAKCIGEAEPRFKYIDADSNGMLAGSRDRRDNFQLYAYNTLIEIASSNPGLTHICFLDLDEYLMPINLDNKIPEFINSLSDIDIISFLWYSDVPHANARSFTDVVTRRENQIARMDHVKSCARLSIADLRASHHNFYRSSGLAVSNVLAEQLIDLTDKRNIAEPNRQIISQSCREMLDHDRGPSSWFVFHRIYKSELEYLSSLMRGRLHNGDTSPLKTNRWGYQLPANAITVPSVQLNAEQVSKYLEILAEFRRNCAAESLLRESTEFILSRASALHQLLQARPELVSDFQHLFKCTRYEAGC